MSDLFPLWGAQTRPKSRSMKPRFKRTKSKKMPPIMDADKDLNNNNNAVEKPGKSQPKKLDPSTSASNKSKPENDRSLRERLEQETIKMLEEYKQKKETSEVTYKIQPGVRPFRRKISSNLLIGRPKSRESMRVTQPASQVQTKSNDDEILPHIFRIPGRFRYKVYQYLNIRDRITCQLVCRQMRNEVRRYAGIVANVCEGTTWGPSFMRDIVCETIRVERFQQPKLIPMQLVYKRMYVKHLCFVGSIPHQFVDAFANRCQNVQRLSVYGEVTKKMMFPKFIRKDVGSWRMAETITRFPRKLQHLWQLYLGPPAQYADETIPTILTTFRFPHLRRLIIKVDDYLSPDAAKDIHLAVFDSLRWVHLKELLMKTISDPSQVRYRGHLFLHRPTDVILKASQARQLSRFTFTEPLLDYQLWGLFLCEQRRLQILQYLQLIEYPVYIHIIPRNRHTLVKLAIHVVLWVRKNTPLRLNLALFENCYNLKELYIHVKTPFLPGRSDVFGFRRLPDSLEVLGIYNCLAKAKDVMLLCKLPNLQFLGLVMVKKPKLAEYCMNCHVLRRLLRCRKLEELFLTGFCVSKLGAMSAQRLTQIVGGISKGYTNMFYLRHPDPEQQRWVEVLEEKRFTFKLVDSWGFDLAHVNPPQCAL